jgi:hypothetical protein
MSFVTGLKLVTEAALALIQMAQRRRSRATGDSWRELVSVAVSGAGRATLSDSAFRPAIESSHRADALNAPTALCPQGWPGLGTHSCRG